MWPVINSPFSESVYVAVHNIHVLSTDCRTTLTGDRRIPVSVRILLISVNHSNLNPADAVEPHSATARCLANLSTTSCSSLPYQPSLSLHDYQHLLGERVHVCTE